MSKSVRTTLLYEATYNSGDVIGLEAQMDYAAQRSRYTEVETPVQDDEKTERAENILAGLTTPQLNAAQTVGMASMSFAEAGRVLGREASSVMMAWYRVVEKATGETPPVLDRRRTMERKRNRVKNPRRIGGGPEHGTNSTYVNYQCKCDECKAAHAAWQRQWKAKRDARKHRLIHRAELQATRRAQWVEIEQETGVVVPQLQTARRAAKNQRERLKQMRIQEKATGVTAPELARYRQQKVEQKRRRMAKLFEEERRTGITPLALEKHRKMEASLARKYRAAQKSS